MNVRIIIVVSTFELDSCKIEQETDLDNEHEVEDDETHHRLGNFSKHNQKAVAALKRTEVGVEDFDQSKSRQEGIGQNPSHVNFIIILGRNGRVWILDAEAEVNDKDDDVNEVADVEQSTAVVSELEPHQSVEQKRHNLDDEANY